jgi:hypothetical protein
MTVGLASSSSGVLNVSTTWLSVCGMYVLSSLNTNTCFSVSEKLKRLEETLSYIKAKTLVVLIHML